MVVTANKGLEKPLACLNILNHKMMGLPMTGKTPSTTNTNHMIKIIQTLSPEKEKEKNHKKLHEMQEPDEDKAILHFHVTLLLQPLQQYQVVMK